MSISILIVRVFSPMSSFQTGISDSPKVDLGEGVSKSSFHALLIPASHQPEPPRRCHNDVRCTASGVAKTGMSLEWLS